MTAPNLLLPTNIIGKTVTFTCTATLDVVLANGAASGKLLKLNVVRAANIVSSSQIVDITIYRAAAHKYLLKNATVNPGVSMIVCDKNEYIYLEEGDALYAKGSTAASVDLTVHYEEIYT